MVCTMQQKYRLGWNNAYIRIRYKKIIKLAIGTSKEVFLSFYLPDQNNVGKVSGTIVYVERNKNPVDSSETAFIGIKFKDISNQTNEQLKKIILSKE